MSLPKPEPGLVLNYRYLWRNEHEAGRTEGVKDRPCVVVVATEDRGGKVEVVVAPVTHRMPASSDKAVELPPKVKQHLGLDEGRSWVVADDLNVFLWPGFDLHPIPGGQPRRFDYGFIPPRLFLAIRERILACGVLDGSATSRSE